MVAKIKYFRIFLEMGSIYSNITIFVFKYKIQKDEKKKNTI